MIELNLFRQYWNVVAHIVIPWHMVNIGLSILYSHCTCTILLQYNHTKTESFGNVLPLTGTLWR